MLSETLICTSLSSRPGSSAVISISLSVSDTSMFGSVTFVIPLPSDGKPAVKFSNSRSISFCKETKAIVGASDTTLAADGDEGFQVH